MKFEIEIEKYSKENGIQLRWEKGFSIDVKIRDNEAIIIGNKEGLLSLARHLITLAQDEVLEGTHIHLDEYNSLDDESADLIIEKKK